jgi:neutral amino acid transport system permease protein
MGGSFDWGRAAQLLVEGIKFGAIIAITAVGLSLVFGTTKLINFAHGEFVTIGAVAAFFLSTSPGNLPLVLAAVLAMVVAAVVSGGFEVAMWRPLRNRGTGLIQMFIVAIGLALLLRHVVLIVFGSRRRQYDEYTLQQAWDLGLFRITPRDLTITLLSFAIMLAVALMLQRTQIGKAMRAVNDNSDLAKASGIDVERVILIVWILGGALAGLGGVFFGLTQAVYPEMGFALLLLMFAAVILGGLGSAYGAMIGALVIGVVSQMSTLWFPASLQYMWALLAMIIVLLVRPQGILGRRERVG